MTNGQNEAIQNQYPNTELYGLAQAIDGECRCLNGDAARYASSKSGSTYRQQLLKSIMERLDVVNGYIADIRNLMAEDLAAELSVEPILDQGEMTDTEDFQ